MLILSFSFQIPQQQPGPWIFLLVDDNRFAPVIFDMTYICIIEGRYYGTYIIILRNLKKNFEFDVTSSCTNCWTNFDEIWHYQDSHIGYLCQQLVCNILIPNGCDFVSNKQIDLNNKIYNYCILVSLAPFVCSVDVKHRTHLFTFLSTTNDQAEVMYKLIYLNIRSQYLTEENRYIHYVNNALTLIILVYNLSCLQFII